VGEAGAAKTQLCLQLLLAAQLPRAVGGLDGAAVYIHTEGRAPLTRLKQLIACHPNVAPHLPPAHDPLDHIYLVGMVCVHLPVVFPGRKHVSTPPAAKFGKSLFFFLFCVFSCDVVCTDVWCVTTVCGVCVSRPWCLGQNAG
jgi:RecA/RadA recombinase